MVNVKVGAVLAAIGGAISLSLFAGACLQRNVEIPAIVPVPQHVQLQKGCFRVDPGTSIVVDRVFKATGEMLAAQLRNATGYAIPLRSESETATTSAIILTSPSATLGLGAEGYTLEVTPESVTVRGAAPAGLFYGTQTLLQLFPPQIFTQETVTGQRWTVPCLPITDQPRFAWRGLMLDVSRHFLKPAEVKKLIDAMALHKLNTFHWHLTDDQGWRVEIKKYPRLTEVGAWRKRIGFNLDPKASSAYGSDGRYGGYYTQAEVRDIVRYAEARHIRIVPEIELPGHSSAALAAYPQYSCSGGPYSTEMTESVSAGVYCAGKEETFQFLCDVLSQVMGLFPGEFIHIGGDEVPRQNWHNCPRCQGRMKEEGLANEHQLEDYFIRRIETFVHSHGKRLIGWSEIQNDHLLPETVVMDWIGGGAEAARAGNDVVMTPEDFCYLDFYQSLDRSSEPAAAGAYLPLAKVYAFEPLPPGLPSEAQARVLGAQGNLWTEYMSSLAQVEYMAFPRLCALAEVLWSPKTSRHWPDFVRRLQVHEQRLDRLGIRYRRGNE